MKILSLLVVLAICASGALAAAPQAATDTADLVSAPDSGVQACPGVDALQSVELVPPAVPQAPINQCKIDCREDYGACLISTPAYICDALYRTCLSYC